MDAHIQPALTRPTDAGLDAFRSGASGPRLINFSVGDKPFSIAADSVVEVIRPVPMTPFGGHPAVIGLINLRGEIVAVVDLGLALGLSSANDPRTGKLFILDWKEGDVRMAARVDSIELDPDAEVDPLFEEQRNLLDLSSIKHRLTAAAVR
jgi:hypothetical protein